MVQEKINSLVSFSCSGGDWCGCSRSHIRHWVAKLSCDILWIVNIKHHQNIKHPNLTKKHLRPALTFCIRHISLNHTQHQRLVSTTAAFTSKKVIKTFVSGGRAAFQTRVQLSSWKAVHMISRVKIKDHINDSRLDAPRICCCTNIQDTKFGRFQSNPSDQWNKGTTFTW